MHPVHHIPTNTPYRPSADAWASSGPSVVSVEELQPGTASAQEDETEEEEGSANPCQGRSWRGQSEPAVPLAWKLGHHRWDCPAQSWR